MRRRGAALTALLGRTWPHTNGTRLGLAKFAIDTGYESPAVYGGARLWTVAVAIFKSETYRFLRLSPPTDEDLAAGARFSPGFLHLPRGSEAEWVKQLVAEQLVTVTTRRGFSRLEMAEAARTQ